jgi:hypothetical protein
MNAISKLINLYIKFSFPISLFQYSLKECHSWKVERDGQGFNSKFRFIFARPTPYYLFLGDKKLGVKLIKFTFGGKFLQEYREIATG